MTVQHFGKGFSLLSHRGNVDQNSLRFNLPSLPPPRSEWPSAATPMTRAGVGARRGDALLMAVSPGVVTLEISLGASQRPRNRTTIRPNCWACTPRSLRSTTETLGVHVNCCSLQSQPSPWNQNGTNLFTDKENGEDAHNEISFGCKEK